MKQAARKDFVEAFARGLEVIKAFDELHPVLGISEVAERANLARPTAHRFLLTLEELGYVISTPGGYMLTPKIVDLGMAYISSRGIFNLAQTHMEKLVHELDQSCSLTQLDGSDVVYVARVTVPKIIHLAVTVGARLPAVGTAMGHVLLAELDDEKLDEVIQTPTLSVFVAVQHYTRDQLFEQINFTRQNGYSISDERLSYGVRAVAVPIRARDGSTPISSPSGPSQWLFQGPPAESKFLAANNHSLGKKTRIQKNQNTKKQNPENRTQKNMKTTCLPNNTNPTKSSRPMRRFFGLAIAAIAAIGLSAPLASADTIPVINGNFETEYGAAAVGSPNTTNWVKLTNWSLNNTSIGSVPITGAFSSSADGGSKFTRFTYNESGAEQNLSTNVAVGDTLSVTFNFGKAINAWGGSNNTGVVYFKIGTQFYYQDCVVSGEPAGTWKSFTFTTTATNAGELSLGFRVARTTANNQYASVDGVSDVTWTPATIEQDAPTSTGATLAALENTATPLAAGDFGYADANSSPLSNVQIVSLPALGTLTYNGNPVANNDIIAAADIGNLSYLSPLGGFGSPYTTMLVKVQNSASPTGLWSLPAVMTVNVTDVNHAPTSTGGAVTMSVLAGPSLAFATANFNFSDIDAGDTLEAVKVTSLPTNGTLTLSASPVTLDQIVDVADISAGNLIYTPTVGYIGADTYNFQVRDATDFSADAIMAISVTADIIVQNGSFETTGQGLGGPWFKFGSPWSITNSPSNYQVINAVAGGNFSSTAAGGGTYIGLVNNDDCPITAPLTQNLGVSVTAGDTLTVTFQRGNPLISSGGAGVAYFDVDGTKYTMPFDTTGMTAGTWQLTTMTQTITNSGNLTLGFHGTTGNGVNVWVDLVSNISVTTGGGPTPVSYADWATTNGVTGGVSGDSNNDGVQNGVAYFMGVTGLATNPGLDANNQVIWPMSSTFSGTYEVQTSSDLSTWTAASPQPTASGGNLTYTLPSGLGTQFVRLVVTPN